MFIIIIIVIMASSSSSSTSAATDSYNTYYSASAVNARLFRMKHRKTNRLLQKYNVKPKVKYCHLADCKVELRYGAKVGDPEYVKLYKCGGCQLVQYCCPEHQRQDWVGNHRTLCANIASFLKGVDERHHVPHHVYINETRRSDYLLNKKIMPYMHGVDRPPAWMMTALGAAPDEKEIWLPRGLSLVMFRSIEQAEKFVSSDFTDASCLELKYTCVRPDDVATDFRSFNIVQLSDEHMEPVRRELVQMYRSMAEEAVVNGPVVSVLSLQFIMFFYIFGTINPYTTYCVMRHKQQ